MSEPDIQIQRDYPQTLVNSQWVKWAAERIAELEQEVERLRKCYEGQVLQTTALDRKLAELEAELEKESFYARKQKTMRYERDAQLAALREALDYVYRDCKVRAVDGVVPLGIGCWDKVRKALQESSDE